MPLRQNGDVDPRNGVVLSWLPFKPIWKDLLNEAKPSCKTAWESLAAHAAQPELFVSLCSGLGLMHPTHPVRNGCRRRRLPYLAPLRIVAVPFVQPARWLAAPWANRPGTRDPSRAGETRVRVKGASDADRGRQHCRHLCGSSLAVLQLCLTNRPHGWGQSAMPQDVITHPVSTIKTRLQIQAAVGSRKTILDGPNRATAGMDAPCTPIKAGVWPPSDAFCPSKRKS